VLSVPSEFFAYGTQSIGWFNIVSSAVTVPTPVTITATQNGTGIVRSTVVNVVPATAPPVTDVVQVQLARFKFVGGRGGNIEVNMTSSECHPAGVLPPRRLRGFQLVNDGGDASRRSAHDLIVRAAPDLQRALQRQVPTFN
jgi:hypothetical protein